MRKTEFIKAPRARDWWLKWHDNAADRFYEAFFAGCGGRPLLAVTARDWDNHEISRQVYTLTIKDLRERDMIEEVAAPNRRPAFAPGGCLRNYADPAPHCPGCVFRCQSYEIGGADNGGLSPAT
jgi:hypothetical protein